MKITRDGLGYSKGYAFVDLLSLSDIDRMNWMATTFAAGRCGRKP